MRILKNRIFLSIVCLVLAGVVAFMVIPAMYADKEALITVLRVAKPVLKGELIEQTALESVEVGAFNLPDGIILDAAEIIGKYAQTDLSKGDYIFSGKLGNHIFDKTLDELLSKGLRLVTVTVPSTAAGLSAYLKRGDIVTIATFIPEKERITQDGAIYEPAQIIISPELSGLAVYGVENAQTGDTEQAREQKESGESTAADPVPKLVTLIVTQEQAVKLIEAEYVGKLHVIFEKRGVE